jgi:alginate O-acetyltransferase complex protein AlgI
VFTLSGLWHGAAWTFVVWGFYHGVLSILERTPPVKRMRAALPRAVNVFVTFFLVVVGWVFFRAQSWRTATGMLRCMFTFAKPAAVPTVYWGMILPTRSIVILIGALLVSVVGGAFVTEEAGDRAWARTRLVGIALAPIALVLVLLQLVNSGFSPLIYFKF